MTIYSGMKQDENDKEEEKEKDEGIKNKEKNIILILCHQTIFVLIFTTFRPMRLSAFFRCFMSNLGADTGLRNEPFI